ncbi:conserved hypothetical protein [Rippkaea orientalis PCC 8801]|uniref:Uncharacterized protein n=1 Tax=Rippkaea orientalis (strain PCC 8801 / RF-1) TaxID=41431 RepID=B7JWS9_RIPO1|nr:hypothetical protein [Rippkaea orientalis]ACK65778.1 conserved hypothetical protein [Rippkaea orientalis PCC 8801]
MERGLLWLPLLIMFLGLAWSGWNEYQKIETYRQWAENFDQAKYDIYAIIGVKDKQITWGKPRRSLPQNLPSFSLENVTNIRLLVNNQPVEINALPTKGNPILEFILTSDQPSIKIPFTEIPLAAKWLSYLEQLRNSPTQN